MLLIHPPIRPKFTEALHSFIKLDTGVKAQIHSNPAYTLGFRLVAVSDKEPAWPISSPSPGTGTVILPSSHSYEVRVTGWREIPCGIQGVSLVHAPCTAINGALLIQEGHAVCVLQSTHTAIWGFPLDLVKGGNDSPTRFPLPLRLLKLSLIKDRYSDTYERHIRSIDRQVEFTARAVDVACFNETNPSMLVANKKSLDFDRTMFPVFRHAEPFLPTNIQCLFIRGVQIYVNLRGGLEVGLSLEDVKVSPGRILTFNGLKNLTLSQVLHIVEDDTDVYMTVDGENGPETFSFERRAPTLDPLPPLYKIHKYAISCGDVEYEEEKEEEEPDYEEEREEEHDTEQEEEEEEEEDSYDEE